MESAISWILLALLAALLLVACWCDLKSRTIPNGLNLAVALHNRGVLERHGVELIGADIDGWPDLLRERGAHLHLYGKGEARPGRKMGHVTRVKR